MGWEGGGKIPNAKDIFLNHFKVYHRTTDPLLPLVFNIIIIIVVNLFFASLLFSLPQTSHMQEMK
jgi:hypothetical protein